jgi:hypothetical protein
VPQYEATVSTTMAVTKLTCDAVYDNLNGSILSVTNLSPIGPSPVKARELLLFYNTTFNNPLNPSPLDIPSLLSVSSAIGPASPYSATKAFLALPYLIFQPLNPSFNDNYLFSGPAVTVTTCSGGWAVSRIVIEKWTVITFSIIMLGVYFWCVVSVGLAMYHPSPPTTQFPLLDFASRVTSGTSSVQNVFDENIDRDEKDNLIKRTKDYLNT